MLTGKVCVVTGAAAGIGRATAIEMAQQQAAAVVVSDIDDTGGNETVSLIQAAGGTASYLHCDMEEGDQIRALVDGTIDQFGALDVLHNNAGIHESQFTTEVTVETLDEEIWDKIYRVNLRGLWLCTKHAAPHLRRSRVGAAIINACSVSGLTGYPGCPAYNATKGAILQLTRATAIDLAPDVRCNCYCPGAVLTNMLERFRDAAPDEDAVAALDKNVLSTHLLPRYGQSEDVAKLVCFLASDDASWITGSHYVIDGGVMAWRGANS